MDDYKKRTLETAKRNKEFLHNKFVAEVERLLKSDIVPKIEEDPNWKSLIFGVALENVANLYIYGLRKNNRSYQLLKKV